MTQIEQDILRTLVELDAAGTAMRNANPKPYLLPLFAKLDDLAGRLPPDADAELRHFLQRKSYEKARAMGAMREMMDRLRLTVNEDKTGRCRIPQGHFDFLGYTFGRCYSTQSGRAYIGTRPSKKSVKRMIDSIRTHTDRKLCWLEATEVVERLNLGLVGWANHFCLGPVSKAYKAIDAYTITRLRSWLCHKHKVRGGGRTRYPDEYFQEHLGLTRLWKSTQGLPWAKA